MKTLAAILAALSMTACAPRMLTHRGGAEICVYLKDGTEIALKRSIHSVEIHDGRIRVYNAGSQLVLDLTMAETKRVEPLPCAEVH